MYSPISEAARSRAATIPANTALRIPEPLFLPGGAGTAPARPEPQYAFKVPVIAISHLRKSNSKDDVKVPGLDEFIGSSNKVKEATCVIMLAPDDESNMQVDSNTKYTWCCIRKLRQGGIDNTAARIYFDIRKGEYLENYNIYHINYSGTKIL